jgi:hypothetical protein
MMLAEALQVLMVYAEQPANMLIIKKLKKKQLAETDEGSSEVVFAQMKKTKMIKKGLCFCCREKGHKASEGERRKRMRRLQRGTPCTCSSNSHGWRECTQASCAEFLCKGVCWWVCSAKSGPVASRLL